MARRVYIVGGGVAGLAAALQLSFAGERVAIYEAAPFAGGRCRSFHDRDLDAIIDNGNHLVFSGNQAIQDYLHLSGGMTGMLSPEDPIFPFMDMGTGDRWAVHMGEGRVPWWLLDKDRRVAGTTIAEYASVIQVMMARKNQTVTDVLDTRSPLYKRFWEPLVIGALNTEAEQASAQLLASVVQQSFLAGGAACLPMIPQIGLSETFVQPCLKVLEERGVRLHTKERLRSMAFDDTHVRQLDFNGNRVEVAPEDWVVLALPPWIAQAFLPEIEVPNEYRSIISVHFRTDLLRDRMGAFIGLVGGMSEWIFVKNGIVSVTISCAERYGKTHVRSMVEPVWKEVARVFDLDPDKIPAYKIFKEIATIAATPAQNARRPLPLTTWGNLVLAGEWTATGLPTTIEGAIRSGFKAGQIIARWGG